VIFGASECERERAELTDSSVAAPSSLLIPQPIAALGERLFSAGLLPQRPNYVLVNRYEAGEGIHPHVDDLFYEDGIASLTLGSSVGARGERRVRAQRVRAHGAPQAMLRFFRSPSGGFAGAGVGSWRDHTPPPASQQCFKALFRPGDIFFMQREARYNWRACRICRAVCLCLISPQITRCVAARTTW
jgi:hypothetical protein